MRNSTGILVGVALSLAGPLLGGGCSSERVIDETNSVGGGPDISSGIEPNPPFTDVGGGSNTPPQGVWHHPYGDAEDQTMAAMAANEAGEIALIGTARGTIDFGNIPWEGSTTDSDVVVAKITEEGQALWSRRYGDSCDQRGGAVAHGASGDVLIAGDFCGKMDFGTTTVEAKGGEVDLFVAVIDMLGEDVYSRSFGGKGTQIARAAAVDADGNAVIVGSFDQTFDDGAGAVSSAGLDDIFVLKLDPAGKLLWSRRFGGLEADAPRAVAIDGKGNIVIGGSFGGIVDFGGGPHSAATGYPSAFLIELDPDGNHLWSQSFASQGAVVNGLAINTDGLIAVAGSVAGTVDLGAGPITTGGGDDAFVATVDSAGKVVRGLAFGGPGAQSGNSVAFGANGVLALTGTAHEAFDVVGFGIGANPPYAPEMVYVVELDAAGSVLGGRALGSAAPMKSVGVALSGKLEMTIAGSFRAPFADDYGIVEPAGGWDMFLIHRP